MSKLGSKVNLILCEIRQAKINNDKKRQNLWAFRLFKLTYPNLRLLAYLNLSQKELDRECVITALEKTFIYLNKFDPERDGYNWICKTLVRCAYDINESGASKNMYFDAPSYLDEFDPEKHLEKAEFRKVLDNALQTLPKEEQVIINYVLEGLSFREIAAKTRIPKSTVKYRFEKICKKLKNFF